MFKRKLRKIVTIGIAILSMLAATAFPVPALAGPDWMVIQDARDMSALQKKINQHASGKEIVQVDQGPHNLTLSLQNKEPMQDEFSQFHKVGATTK